MAPTTASAASAATARAADCLTVKNLDTNTTLVVEDLTATLCPRRRRLARPCSKTSWPNVALTSVECSDGVGAYESSAAVDAHAGALSAWRAVC